MNSKEINGSFCFVRNDLKLFPITANAWGLIALEAWRRGLKVSLEGGGLYKISSSDKAYSFRLSRLTGSDQRDDANRICRDKSKTKHYFEKSTVPTPAGRNYKDNLELSNVIAYVKEIGFPICLKANNWGQGKGVFPYINTFPDVEKYYNILVHELGCKNICVERHVLGDDHRVFVVGNKVVAALRRIPANVVGDGQSTINTLIDKKNKKRKENPFLRNSSISLDQEVMDKISLSGYSLNHILDKGELLYLRNKSNASTGGDTIDVTDNISEKMKMIAVSAIDAIPGLEHGGVDILTEDISSESSNAAVLEINSVAELGVNIYPLKGESRLIYKDIINYYFPETAKEITGSYDNWYFNIKEPLNIIKNKVASSVEIAGRPRVSDCNYIDVMVSGIDNDVKSLTKNIVSPALKLGVHGQVKVTQSNKVYIKAAGSSVKLRKFISIIQKSSHNSLSNKKVEAFDCVLGFYIDQ